MLPSQEQLKHMSKEALGDLNLEKIRYTLGPRLHCLTFEFSDGTINPPVGSYKSEPEKRLKLVDCK